ncbi:hypothetical protein [Dyadobacter sp. NIV53]|uniref:hypothetical protein n=1 Tax=Dyadobacter sp. NIV53 TaxID=2861765 RepID=UPI001C87C244|nr:hypothetical protein [Dyadobacter sp. NIV53]
MLTVFFLCKSSDVASIVLAKYKITASCDKDNCGNEEKEVEKMIDDQQVVYNSISLEKNAVTVILKTVFSHTVKIENEIFRNLFSPPPELS